VKLCPRVWCLVFLTHGVVTLGLRVNPSSRNITPLRIQWFLDGYWQAKLRQDRTRYMLLNHSQYISHIYIARACVIATTRRPLQPARADNGSRAVSSSGEQVSRPAGGRTDRLQVWLTVMASRLTIPRWNKDCQRRGTRVWTTCPESLRSSALVGDGTGWLPRGRKSAAGLALRQHATGPPMIDGNGLTWIINARGWCCRLRQLRTSFIKCITALSDAQEMTSSTIDLLGRSALGQRGAARQIQILDTRESFSLLFVYTKRFQWWGIRTFSHLKACSQHMNWADTELKWPAIIRPSYTTSSLVTYAHRRVTTQLGAAKLGRLVL